MKLYWNTKHLFKLFYKRSNFFHDDIVFSFEIFTLTYHYFTDAVGALLLGTSLVCLTAVGLRFLRRLRFPRWVRL